MKKFVGTRTAKKIKTHLGKFGWGGNPQMIFSLLCMVFGACGALFLLLFARASGEAILGTQRYFSKHFLIKIVSRLRRGGFRYTTILFKAFFYYFFSGLTTILFKAFYL